MANQSSKFSLVIAAKDRASKVLKGFRKQLSKVGNVAKSLFSPTGIIAGGLAGFGLGKLAGSFIETASSFENLEASLTTTTGSLEKAKEAIAFANKEAAASPFTVMEYAEAIRSLSAYGVDYQKVMTTLGDTAASMGKPLSQAVEAFADALQGEGERLKDFGIKQSVAGDQITYTWTDTMGKVRKTVAKNSPEIIQQTLQAIWNEKYQGGMEKFANTWSGLTSTLTSLWDEFKLAVMESGAFEYMKQTLQLVIDKINEAKKTGDFKKWADQIGQALVDGFRFLVTGIPKALLLILEIISKISMAISGWKMLWTEIKIHALGFAAVVQNILRFIAEGFRQIFSVVNVGGMFDGVIAGLEDFRNSQDQIVKQLNADRTKAIVDQNRNVANYEQDQKDLERYKDTLVELEGTAKDFVSSVDKSIAASKKEAEAANEAAAAWKTAGDMKQRYASITPGGGNVDRSGFSLGDIRDAERTE